MKKNYRTFWVGIIASLIFSCQENHRQQNTKRKTPIAQTMQVTILNKILYRQIPSASGLEINGHYVYVIGDDSPYLYVLDVKTLQLVKTIPLFKTYFFITGRLPKALKPDLECLTRLVIAGDTQLVAFGSGSAPTRAQCYTIKLPVTDGGTAQVKEYSLKPFYIALQKDTALVAGDLLNLEGAALTAENDLLLLQRSTGTGPNAIIRLKGADFNRYLTQPSAPLPAYAIYYFRLPKLAGIPSRFSGAYTFADKLFFTASVENTTNAILDGNVLGSFVGYLPLATMTAAGPPAALQTALIRNKNGQPYPGKVESLVILGQDNPNTYRGLAITDNDNGESELLQIRIKL